MFPLRLLSVWLLILVLTPVSSLAQEAAVKEEKAEAHIGTVEQALVGVEVVNTAPDGTKQVRRGNGFVLRCDGFVLIPTGLLAQKEMGEGARQSIGIVLNPGSDGERRVFPRTRPFVLKSDLGYTVVKLRDVHLPALPTLLPDALKEGDGLEVAFCAFDANRGRFGAIEKSKLVVGAALAKEKANGLRGAREYTEVETNFPPGAILIGEDGMAVGVFPGVEAGARSRFVTFELLHQTTNCVTAMPTSDAEFKKRLRVAGNPRANAEPAEGEAEPGEARPEENEKSAPGKVRALGDMVYVPGGRIHLTPALLEYQRDMDRVAMACVAPFWMDKYEVTNAQYLKFWSALPAKQRNDPLTRERLYPLSWAEQGEPFPGDLEELPVLGVRLEGARAYAKWAGKRLPTPYEWSLAAFGPEGGNTLPEWTGRYLLNRQQNWERVRKTHFEFLRANPELQPRFRGEVPVEVVYVAGMPTTRLAPHENPRSWHLLPWFFWLPEHGRLAEWSQRVVREATDSINKAWKDPLSVLTGGERKYDVSPYGVYDMGGNAIEVICPVPEFNEKRMELSLYMQLAWIATERRGPVLSRLLGEDLVAQYEAVMNDTPNGRANWGEFPLLARRLRSATDNIARLTDYVPPHYTDMVGVGASLFEAGALLRPLSHGVVRLFEGPTANIGTVGASADGSPALPPVFSDGRTQVTMAQAAAFPLWNGMPRYFHREMGRLFALDPLEGSAARTAVLTTSRTVPTDTTLLPGGFRCAR